MTGGLSGLGLALFSDPDDSDLFLGGGEGLPFCLFGLGDTECFPLLGEGNCSYFFARGGGDGVGLPRPRAGEGDSEGLRRLFGEPPTVIFLFGGGEGLSSCSGEGLRLLGGGYDGLLLRLLS